MTHITLVGGGALLPKAMLALTDAYVDSLQQTFQRLVRALQATAVGRVQFDLQCGLLRRRCFWVQQQQGEVVEQEDADPGPALDCLRNSFVLELVLRTGSDVLQHPLVHGILRAVAKAMQSSSCPTLLLYVAFVTWAAGAAQAAVTFSSGSSCWARPTEWKYEPFASDLADEHALAAVLTKAVPGTGWRSST